VESRGPIICTLRSITYFIVFSKKLCPDFESERPAHKAVEVPSSCRKKRFTMTAPGLRKQGYNFLVTSLKRDEQDVEKIGERVSEVRGFRYYSMYEDSRNVTAQLYSTLIRRLEIEARLVTRACNLRDLCRESICSWLPHCSACHFLSYGNFNFSKSGKLGFQ
jgi:hypothetical protein